MSKIKNAPGRPLYIGIDFGVNADQLDSAGMSKYCSIVICQAVRHESGGYYLRLKYANKLKVTEIYDLMEKKFSSFALMYIDRTSNPPAAGGIKRVLGLEPKHYRDLAGRTKTWISSR